MRRTKQGRAYHACSNIDPLTKKFCQCKPFTICFVPPSPTETFAAAAAALTEAV